jgi:hypothetical protein
MNGRLQQWDICALHATPAGEKWSYRKSLVFLLASSSACWAGVILLLRLTSL